MINVLSEVHFSSNVFHNQGVRRGSSCGLITFGICRAQEYAAVIRVVRVTSEKKLIIPF